MTNTSTKAGRRLLQTAKQPNISITKDWEPAGTLTSKKTLSSPRVITFVVDEQMPSYISLAFDSKSSDHRKRWLRDWCRLPYPIEITHQTVSHFIDQELTSYHFANLRHAIHQSLT